MAHSLKKVPPIPGNSPLEQIGRMRRELHRQLDSEEACRHAREVLLKGQIDGALTLSQIYTQVHALLRAETQSQQCSAGLLTAIKALEALRPQVS